VVHPGDPYEAGVLGGASTADELVERQPHLRQEQVELHRLPHGVMAA